jgi:hypothetical protein
VSVRACTEEGKEKGKTKRSEKKKRMKRKEKKRRERERERESERASERERVESEYMRVNPPLPLLRLVRRASPLEPGERLIAHFLCCIGQPVCDGVGVAVNVVRTPPPCARAWAHIHTRAQ